MTFTVSDSAGNLSSLTETIQIEPIYDLEETFELNDYDLRISSYWFNRTDSEPAKGYYSYYTAEKGNTFLITNLYVKNKDDIRRQPFDIFGKDEDMIKAEVIINGVTIYRNSCHSLDNNWYDLLTSISPKSYKTKRLSFEVSSEEIETATSIIIKFYEYINEDKYCLVRIK